MFDVTPLYGRIAESNKKFIVGQGGTYSGKTYAKLQRCFILALAAMNATITVVGQDIPNLKSGAIRDAKSIVRDSPILQRYIRPVAKGKFFNDTDRVYTFWNGSIIEFKSYSNEQDAKSGKRDYLFINECNGVDYPICKQLFLRTEKQIFLDYNPTIEFWVHEELIGMPEVDLIISDHRHNTFLSASKHAELEALRYTDPDLFKVYGRGITGKLEGLVFRNWETVDFVPEEAQLVGRALDFGFTNDPSGLLDVYRYNGELFLDERLYETNLTNQDLSERFADLGINRKEEVICDSAEPKSIQELKDMGWRTVAAQKGPDSVKASIDILKRFRMNITRSSLHLRKELLSYKWKVNKHTGKSENSPVDFMNHLIDPLRYVALNKLSESNRPVRPARVSM